MSWGKGRIRLCLWVLLRVMNCETRLTHLCLTGLLKWLCVIKESACVHILGIMVCLKHNPGDSSQMWTTECNHFVMEITEFQTCWFPLSIFLRRTRQIAVQDFSLPPFGIFLCNLRFFPGTWGVQYMMFAPLRFPKAPSWEGIVWRRMILTFSWLDFWEKHAYTVETGTVDVLEHIYSFEIFCWYLKF